MQVAYIYLFDKKASGPKYFQGKNINVVSYYKYLGVLFTSNLNWKRAVHALSVQTKKALGMLTSYSKKCGGLPVKVALQLFDKMVVPIMLSIQFNSINFILENIQTYKHI